MLCIVQLLHVGAFVPPHSFQDFHPKIHSKPSLVNQVAFAKQKVNHPPLKPSHYNKIVSSSCVLQSSFSTMESMTSVDSSSIKKENIIGDVVLLIPSQDADSTPTKFGACSPMPYPSVQDASHHLEKKIHYFSDGTVQVHVLPIPTDVSTPSETLRIIENANAVVALKLSSPLDISNVAKIFKTRRNLPMSKRQYQCQFALDCSSNFAAFVGPYDDADAVSNPITSLTTNFMPWTTFASAQRLELQMIGLFSRWTSDDFTIALMIFFNLFNSNRDKAVATDSTTLPTTIPWVQHSIDATWEKGPIQNAQEFYKMISKCGPCISKCLADPNCKACIDALNEVDTRDQVASYRTIVSYESELLREFSFCILQKNNIFGCNAAIPTIPKVEPLKGWRGKESLTKEDAQGILIGHLDDEDAPEGGGGTEVSWKVACGANVAYDQFPSQNQLFYTSLNGRDMWYDPVFRVETIDGRSVWCKRHYKVRHGKVPGTFHFSVLDNGVTSNEFWTVAGCADDLSWVVFHYAGAASAVGQRYLGGLLCTADGSLPPEESREEIWKVMRNCGMEPWELFVVDNNLQSPGAIEAGKPPLDFFRADVLRAKAEKKAQN